MLNTKCLVFDTNFLVFNTKFIIFTHVFIHPLLRLPPPQTTPLETYIPWKLNF